MTFPFLGNSCAGLANCGAFRGVVCVCNDPANDGLNLHMYNWLNGFDLTTIPWGYLYEYTFSKITLISPDGGPTPISYAGTLGFSQWFVIDQHNAPNVDAIGNRSQIWLPGNSPFGVIAVDAYNGLQTGYLCCTGTTSPCGNIVETPVPNSTLPAGVPWRRLRYNCYLGGTPSNIDTIYVNQMTGGIAPNYGTAMTSTPSSPWDETTVCFPPPNDPFDDANP